MSKRQPALESAILVGAIERGSRPLLTLEDSLRELALLAETAGLEISEQISQVVHHINPATFIGSGKAEEIRLALEDSGARVVIFDDELSPRHQRELEKRLGQEIKVLDRSALILDIFAQHAHTREGSLQVELAQYEYRLPRLTRQWTHLARQAGSGSVRGDASGVGLRGPGETQLEVDRREIGRRIAKLKRDLERVREHRGRHRMQRRRAGLPVAALVGYTNAGKSTLLNTLSGADVYVADQLFATLDPTTRRIALPSGREALITDTVGFIQKLPATLIAAFRATLEEITEATVLLHVADVAHPNAAQHLEAVADTLAELDVPNIPRILVWNKMDAWKGQTLPQVSDPSSYVAQVEVSAITGLGLEDLITEIEKVVQSHLRPSTLMIPYHRGDLISLLHETAIVEKQEHIADGVVLCVHLPSSQFHRFKDYEVLEP